MHHQMILSIHDNKHIADACRAGASAKDPNVVIVVADAHCLHIKRLDGVQKSPSIVAAEKPSPAFFINRLAKTFGTHLNSHA